MNSVEHNFVYVEPYSICGKCQEEIIFLRKALKVSEMKVSMLNKDINELLQKSVENEFMEKSQQKIPDKRSPDKRSPDKGEKRKTPQKDAAANKKVCSDNEMEDTTIVFENDPEKCQMLINAEMESLKHTRNYNLSLQKVKQMRNNTIQSNLSIDNYISYVKSQLEEIKSIFIRKSWSEQKISLNIFPKFLTPLEYLFTLTPGLSKQVVDIEDIQKFIPSSLMQIECNGPFSHEHFYKFFVNPSICLWSLSNLIKRLISNSSKTLVYYPFEMQTKAEDHYSFYYLFSETDSVKHWKMDCRLEKLTTELIQVIQNYCIYLFREIYQNCLKTNAYIPKYKSRFSVLEVQSEQLLQNLFLTTQFHTINKILREYVEEYATINLNLETTENIVDFKNDDIHQKLNFQDFSISDSKEYIDMTKRLFDGIDDDEAADFFKDYTNNNLLLILE